MREFKRIILHCTATPPGMHVDVATVRKWHKARGWSDCGYHFLLHLDGTIERGRPIHKVGAHTKQHNEDSVGVAYAGGVTDEMVPHDTMTVYQEISFLLLVRSLRTVYGPMTIHGHNEFANKACPSFTVRDKFKFLILHEDGVSD